ncbi:asparagine synthetase B family protein [Rheinheimera sp. D18]|uniref:asparagine synthase-related protein n=1 Tax=Rheinheimera sp. D18 TaxID=2545632 RepID=UPI00104F9A59|nr:asparagine synthetase B family protein [Rheinheimera sp. D18]QBL09780.1 asparagine synthetase B family protein [Rheinheimera sp. D18]
MRIAITGRFGKLEKAKHIWLSGQAYLHNQLITAQQLHDMVLDAIITNTLKQQLKQLQGFFSIVVQYQQQVYLITDKVRSRPLFYCHTTSGWQVSDQPEQLFYNTGTKENCYPTDKLAAEAFAHLGWTPGKLTLKQNVFQVQAAEVVSLNWLTGGYSSLRYYYFVPKNLAIADNVIKKTANALHSELDKALTLAIERLVYYAGGRQVVIPLSGGYDSRIIALYLSQMGYKNTLCFTFGRAGSPEANMSKAVAATLGLSWHYVPYTKSMWRTLLKQPDFNRYMDFCHHSVSVPNIQVFPALSELLKRGIIKPDAVLVPGHTGDFISGGHIVENYANVNSLDELTQAVIKRHFVYSGNPLSEQLYQHLQQSLTELLAGSSPLNCPMFSLAETWNWQERQAKFIVNSNRYYDYLQLDWWMPLWDDALLAFWQQVPLEQRLGKKLWKQFIDQKMQALAPGKAVTGNAATINNPLWRRITMLFNYFTDDNALYALVPFSHWLACRLKLRKAPATPFGILIKKYLQKEIDKN